MKTNPARNQYLIGLGLGLILGGLITSEPGASPTLAVVIGLVFGATGVILSFFEDKKNGKKS